MRRGQTASHASARRPIQSKQPHQVVEQVMPKVQWTKVQWTNLPPALRDHLFDRVRERKISAEDLCGLLAGKPVHRIAADHRSRVARVEILGQLGQLRAVRRWEHEPLGGLAVRLGQAELQVVWPRA